ncbi:MAG: GMC family oxidoreductase [Saprospiraceae bacterium]
MAENKVKYDVIIIGAGMAGSFAAKEFCDAGIKTLLLERGRDVQHNVDYPTTNMNPWEFKYKGDLPYALKKEMPIQTKCYACREDAAHFFVKDTDHPYVQDKPFDWLRGYQVGGKSIMWARQTQRWSDFDFEGPARDGYAIDWPIRYKDLAPWYDKVEHFIGVSGNKDGLDMLPDGDFLKAWDLNCVEDHFKEKVKENYKDRHVIYARCAHLTEVREIHKQQGRTLCQSRNLCQRGCPFGGYFNTNSTLIPWAKRSGNLTLRPHSVVESIVFDEKLGKATSVNVVDENTKESISFEAKVIFVCGATINSNILLLNSKSDRFPNGLGNDSGVLGKYVAFHNYNARISAKYEGFLDKVSESRKPTSAYLPRFRNLRKQETDFLRGYAATFGGSRGTYGNSDGFGTDLLENLMETPKLADHWSVGSQMMGETIPKESNFVALDASEKDQWGVPLVHINVDYDDNDAKMEKDFIEQYTDMFEKAGFIDIQAQTNTRAPGNDIHEMGGVRMGKDAITSILNGWNQMHAVPNVFVTDGSCMTSVSTQNPSITFMAMSARAANYAIEQMKKGEL